MKNLLTLLIIIPFLHLFGQGKVSETYFVYVNYPDYTVKTCVDNRNKKLEVNRNRTYYWYASNKIQETMGGADGKVLHGQYTSYYLNGNLKEKGVLKSGLKNSEWAQWYENGKLKELSNWKKGVQCGTLSSYDINGNLLSSIRYKKGKMNGCYITYKSGQLIEKKKFKNGNEIIAKEKKRKNGILKQWFKKTDKDHPNNPITAPERLKKEKRTKKETKEKARKEEKKNSKQKQSLISNYIKYFKIKKEQSQKKEFTANKKIKEYNSEEEKNRNSKVIEFPIKKKKND